MIIEEQSWTFRTGNVEPAIVIEDLASCGRVCYRSQPKGDNSADANFLRNIIKRGHESVLEHQEIGVIIKTNRAIANELVRHRLAAYSQESTRYVDMVKKEMTFIRPDWAHFKTKVIEGTEIWCPLDEDSQSWMLAMQQAAHWYFRLREHKTPEECRDVLPLSLTTKLAMTANVREWRHIFKLRCDKAAHPMIRSLMCDMLSGFAESYDGLFDDIVQEVFENEKA